MQTTVLGQSDDVLGERPDSLGLHLGGLYLAMADELGHLAGVSKCFSS